MRHIADIPEYYTSPTTHQHHPSPPTLLPPQSFSTLPSEEFPYPIISDPNRELATTLGMLDPEEKDKAGLPLTCRAVSHLTFITVSLYV